MESLNYKAGSAAFKARNAARLGRHVIRTPLRVIGRTPVGRVSRMAGRTPVGRAFRTVKNLNPVPKSLRGTLAGSLAIKGWATAALASDINTVNQWSKGVKKRGKITKKDVEDIAKDILNPIPDNIPGLAKKNKYQ